MLIFCNGGFCNLILLIKKVVLCEICDMGFYGCVVSSISFIIWIFIYLFLIKFIKIFWYIIYVFCFDYNVY